MQQAGATNALAHASVEEHTCLRVPQLREIAASKSVRASLHASPSLRRALAAIDSSDSPDASLAHQLEHDAELSALCASIQQCIASANDEPSAYAPPS